MQFVCDRVPVEASVQFTDCFPLLWYLAVGAAAGVVITGIWLAVRRASRPLGAVSASSA